MIATVSSKKVVKDQGIIVCETIFQMAQKEQKIKEKSQIIFGPTIVWKIAFL